MKKLFVSAGLVAVGTASLQAAYAPDLGPMQTTKLWSVSATLRGFYDDNYATVNNHVRGSYGFEVSPEIQFSMPLQQTELGLRYIYGMYYYQDREQLDQSPVDQTHQVDLWVDHAFSERWQATAEDSFVVGQEPQLLQGGTPYRVNGDNIANTGTLTLNTDWTRLLSTVLTYRNSYFDYQNSGTTESQILTNGAAASLAGLLNRVDQTVSLDFQYQLQPQTIAFIGGSFEQVNYVGDEPIAYSIPLGFNTGNPFYYSKSRDNRSYYGYAGVQHNILPNLYVAARGGFQYTDDYNDPLADNSVAPYVNLSLVYTYLPGSYAQVGFTQQRNATDVVTVNVSNGNVKAGSITQDQESSVVYASINQEITSKLMATVIGNWQNSLFEGGQYDSESDTMYSLGLNLTYTFNQHFSADVGYNYDDLQSGIAGRGYTRNRVYLGVTAMY